jgi:hypothetical protein
MSESEVREISKRELPWFYRLILKIPGAEFLENAGGLFWAIIVPVFLIMEFFLSLFLLVSFPFPANVVLVSVIPSATLVLFVKITLKRFINWWNANFGESRFEWNVEKALDEYLSMLGKEQEGKS